MTRPGRKRGKSDQQDRFVQLYVISLNATESAIGAGYSHKSAASQGARLLKNAKVRRAIAAAQAKLAQKFELRAEDVIHELARIGFADMGDYITLQKNGGVRLDFRKIPKGGTRAIQEIIQEERTNEEGITTTRTKFKLYAKQDALDLLGRRLGLWISRHELTGKDGAPLPAAQVHVYLPQKES